MHQQTTHEIVTVIQWDGHQWGRCSCGYVTEMTRTDQPVGRCLKDDAFD